MEVQKGLKLLGALRFDHGYYTNEAKISDSRLNKLYLSEYFLIDIAKK